MAIAETNESPVAVVTGGSRGIGKACVLALASAGYRVAFSYHSNQQAAQQVVESVLAAGGEALSVQANASSPRENQQLIDQVFERWARLDALVNNAGVTRDTLLVRLSDDDWQTVMDTNLAGAFYTTRAAAKIMMKQRSGAIVNITSIVGVYGNAGQANYAASKAGLIGLTKSVAKELGSRNITVNAVAPGFIETDMTEGLPVDKVREHVPLRRLGQPEDIAKAVVFLVTSGSYITGQVLQVDGGLVL
ncbi:MAG: 3-oxoacyl-[acyl-carrier-protein] reductase [Candidatus Melainabacteria bacterium]|nr:3-oxoacyl-[acyl-carrier-protein] reductase [Candidatus Melainabacteria bacterium]